MRALVTRAAGFIGSNLARRLCGEGHDVTGVDSFTEYYERRCLSETTMAQLVPDSAYALVAGQ